MTIDLNEITKGLPGITKTCGKHLYEACIVCLSRHNHKSSKTNLSIIGDNDAHYSLTWEDVFDDQMDRSWADQIYTTEHGAVCVAILVVMRLTNYTVIERSIRKTGFDYWLGEKGDVLFQKKARLEISGIFNGTQKDVTARYKVKLKQTNQSDTLNLPAYIGVVEFSNPLANFLLKK